MSTPFVHLHLHSHYSILDGMGKIEDYIARAMELDMPAMALTDHGVMYGVIDFYKACKASSAVYASSVAGYFSIVFR